MMTRAVPPECVMSTGAAVLRDGQTVGTGTMQGTTLREIVHLMVGRDLDEMFPYTPTRSGKPRWRWRIYAAIVCPRR